MARHKEQLSTTERLNAYYERRRSVNPARMTVQPANDTNQGRDVLSERPKSQYNSSTHDEDEYTKKRTNRITFKTKTQPTSNQDLIDI